VSDLVTWKDGRIQVLRRRGTKPDDAPLVDPLPCMVCGRPSWSGRMVLADGTVTSWHEACVRSVAAEGSGESADVVAFDWYLRRRNRRAS
jgi:hypothetical protein